MSRLSAIASAYGGKEATRIDQASHSSYLSDTLRQRFDFFARIRSYAQDLRRFRGGYGHGNYLSKFWNIGVRCLSIDSCVSEDLRFEGRHLINDVSPSKYAMILSCCESNDSTGNSKSVHVGTLKRMLFILRFHTAVPQNVSLACLSTVCNQMERA